MISNDSTKLRRTNVKREFRENQNKKYSKRMYVSTDKLALSYGSPKGTFKEKTS